MVSKILFVVLVGCAVAFASPVSQDVEVATNSKVSEIIEALQRVFKEIFEKIAAAIAKPLKEAIRKIKERLNTEEFKEAFELLQETLAKVVDENGQINVANEEDKEVIQKEVKKVEVALTEVLQQALAHDEKVDATEFKKAVEYFKSVVDEILAN